MFDPYFSKNLENTKSGELFSFILENGKRFVTPFFKDIFYEFSKKKYPTGTKLSYTKIPEYYTIPMNAPYIDKGPTDPFARFSKQPRFNTNDQTPEVLLEHFGDPMARSYSTIIEMVDMHSNNISFYIFNDKHVIEIYEKLDIFLAHFKNTKFTKEFSKFVDQLNKMLAFKNELYSCYFRCCNKLKHKPINAKNVLESFL